MSASDIVVLINAAVEQHRRKATEQQAKRWPSYTAFMQASSALVEAWDEIVSEFDDEFVQAGDLLASAKMPQVRAAWQDAKSTARSMSIGTPEAVEAATAVVDTLRDPQVAPYLDKGPAALETLRQFGFLEMDIPVAMIARELNRAFEDFVDTLRRDLGLD